MKTIVSKSFRFIPAAVCLSFVLLAINAKAQVTTNYWDITGNTPGASTDGMPNGNWEDMNWTTDPSGSISTANWADGSFAQFSAGTDATGPYTINVSTTTINVAGMAAATGTVTVGGTGTLNLPTGMQPFYGGTLTTPFTINVALAGTGGFQTAAGDNIYLYGNNTFSGGLNLNGGSTYINSASSVGAATGTISPIAGGAGPNYSAFYSTVNTVTLNNPFYVNTANAGIEFVPSTTTPLTLAGNIDVEQDFYCGNSGPGTTDTPYASTTGILTISGNISGPGGLHLRSAGDNSTTIALNGANAYHGQTAIDTTSPNRVTISFNTAQPIGAGIPNSLGEPPDAATGQINLGHPYSASAAFADALRYTGSTDSTTDRIINNANTGLQTGGMWLYAEGTGKITYSGNITASPGGTANRVLIIKGSSTAQNTISGNIQDSTGGTVNTIGLTKTGTGFWAISGNNTFSGGLSLQQGTLSFPSASALGTGALGSAVNDGATFQYTGSGKSTTTLAFNMSNNDYFEVTQASGNFEFNSQVKSKTITKIGPGTLTLSGSGADNSSLGAIVSGGTLVLNKTSTGSYHALGSATTVNSSGTLQLSGSGSDQIYNGVNVVVNSGGVFDMNGRTEQISSIQLYGNGAGSGALINSSSTACTLTAGGTSGSNKGFILKSDTTIGGIGSITLASTGTGSLGVTGSFGLIYAPTATATLTLSSAGSYTGNTTINSPGTLALSGAGSISTSASLSIAGGATFDVSAASSAASLGTSQSLNLGGTGGSSSVIATASGKGLTLGTSSPLQFTAYDGSTVPLTITGAGSLAIGTGNAVTVTTTTHLGVGSYKLVQIGSGNTTAVTGTPATSVTVNGSGAGGTASLRVSGGELYLDVKPTPVTQMNIVPGGGGSFTINYSGGSGSQFVLLQTNNVAAPLINWTRLQTNTAASSSFTITPSLDPMEFYTIKSE